MRAAYSCLRIDKELLKACEEHHADATAKLRKRMKRTIAEPIRKRLRNGRVFPSDKTTAKMAGVDRLTIQRIKDSRGDLSHVSTDTLLYIASILGVDVPAAAVAAVKRQLLLEELIPEFRKRRATDDGDAHADTQKRRPVNREHLHRIERIVVARSALDETAITDGDAYKSWCQSAAKEVGGDEELSASVTAADYLQVRPRLDGFTIKLTALSAASNIEMEMPEEFSAFQRHDDPYLLSDGLALVRALRESAIQTWLSESQWSPDPVICTEELLTRMLEHLPRDLRRVEADDVVALLDYFELNPEQLYCPCENVGSLALKSPRLRSGVLDLLRAGD